MVKKFLVICIRSDWSTEHEVEYEIVGEGDHSYFIDVNGEHVRVPKILCPGYVIEKDAVEIVEPVHFVRGRNKSSRKGVNL